MTGETPEDARSGLDELLTEVIAAHGAGAATADQSAAEPDAEAQLGGTGRTGGSVETFAVGAENETRSTKLAAAASDPEPAAADPSASMPPAQAVTQPIEPPARWTVEDKAKFAAWPRDVQQAVVERCRALEADYTRKTQEAAQIRRAAEPYLNAVKPFEPYLNEIAPALGQTPDQMIASLLGVEYLLRCGTPQQKASALAQIVAAYDIDLAASNQPAVQTEPAYTHLQQELSALKTWKAEVEAQIEAEQQRQAAFQIESFANAKDETGRPRHPHFARVRGVMGELFRDDPTLSLEAAYAQAIEPLQQAIAEELRVREAFAKQQRLAAVEKARKAVPVRSAGAMPNGSAKAKDLDSILSAAIDARLS